MTCVVSPLIIHTLLTQRGVYSVFPQAQDLHSFFFFLPFVILNSFNFFLSVSFSFFFLQLSLVALLGFRVEGLLAAMTLPVLLVMILFLGPLVLSFFDEELPFQSGWSFEDDLLSIFSTLIGVRNFVVAPIAEEFVFRSCVICLLLLAGFSTPVVVFASPLFFGAAHLHHIRDAYKKQQLYGKKSNYLQAALMKTMFQFLYTTVFGWLCAFIYLRTGLSLLFFFFFFFLLSFRFLLSLPFCFLAHTLAPILCHSFCNIMGFPAFERIGEHPKGAAGLPFPFLSFLCFSFFFRF